MPLYTPLPDGSVRLLRLLPHSDEEPGIKCNLFTCTMLSSGRAHPYDALSYVWGPESNQHFIHIDGREVSVRANLYAALSHLQDRFLERILWIDAICINQNDNEEKSRQVQFMARIYAKASSVIVWLGKAADDSDRALKMVLEAARKQHIDSSSGEVNHQPTSLAIQHTNEQAIITLLERPWFRRIWVSRKQ